MADPILETEDLTKTFGALVANDHISIEIPRGAIHGIIGPNGSGKSTLFNTISGFYRPDGGTVRFDGEDVTGARPNVLAKKGLLRTFQISRPFEEMTVEGNLIAVYGSGLRVSGEKRARAAEVMEMLDIGHLADHEAGDLSGGQQKLLDLARIFMLDPKCVLLDEPFAGVNPALQSRIMDYLRAMNEEGTTFVVIEHNMRLIDEITDSVTVLNSGQVIAEGSFADIKDDPRVRQAYLSGGDEDLEEIVA